MFEQATNLPESKRAEFLDQACAGDHDIRSEVASLLDSYEAAELEFEAGIHRTQAPVDASEIISGYQLLSEVHRGGQGVVYRAVQLSTRREVALKFLLAGSLAAEDNRRRFEREVELVSNLSHPGIVPIFDSGLNHDQYFFAMELVDGEPLNVLKRSWKEPRYVLSVLADVCDAIGHAHSHGVIHRDLKPSNILIDRAGRPRVLDFGLAKIPSADRESITLSITGQVLGTPAYMSPEQASGHPGVVDARGDVYSLGVMLYESLTHSMPYELEGSLTDQLSTIQHKPADQSHLRSCGVAADVSAIILKALSKEKSQRYADASQMGADIRRYLSGDPIEARRDSAVYVFRKRARRYRLPIVILSVLILGIMIGAWFNQGGGGMHFDPPLEPLPPGEFYSASDLEGQAMTVRSMVEARQPASQIVDELLLRFQSLEREDFATLDEEAEADLEAMQQLAAFFAMRPSTNEISGRMLRWRARFESGAPGGRVNSSGLVNTLVEDVLRAAAETPDNERYRSIDDQSDRHATSVKQGASGND